MLFNINDYKFELNILDYETALRVEEECEKTKELTNKIAQKAETGMKMSVLIKEATDIVSKFFDHVVGEGTGEKILKGRIDYLLALECFGEFIVQKNNSGDDIKKVSEKYQQKINATLPNRGNREQRRSGNKGKGNKYPNKHYRK